MRKLLLFFLAGPVTVFAQTEHGRKVVETLCSPEFHGRGYVNGGDSIAAEFIAAQLKDAGCKFFRKGVFQPFSFEVNTFPARMSLSIDGRMLIPGTEFVVDPGSGGGIKTGLDLVELTVGDITDQQQLKTKLARLQHTSTGLVIWVADLRGDTLKRARRIARDLTAAFPVIEVVNEKFTWSVDASQTAFPLFAVQQSAIDRMKGSRKADFTVDAVLCKHTARNVIAYAPAKRRSRKFLVFTAHYDHLGRMGRDTYFPGGNDNASGTAMLLELARYFVKHPIDVNVVFMAFAGEEAGLIGSHHYVEHPFFPLNKIGFLTNIDIMGSGEDGVTIVNATLFPEAFRLLTQLNEKDRYVAKVASRGPAANSDHYFFTEAGVPAFFMYTMGPNKHYHDVYDTYGELSFAEFGDIFKLLVEFGSKLPSK